MKQALELAGKELSRVDYINAHATGTEVGDIAESRATSEVMGNSIPISSTKGHTGHTLGGCGAIESAFCLAMFRDDFLPPTRNLDRVDPECAPLDYLRGDARQVRSHVLVNNNFAFGGINTSLIFGRM